MTYKTRNGASPDIKINVLNKLPAPRIKVALKRLRHLIHSTMPLQAVDDESPGSKSTACTWGLCTESKKVWADAQDHTFPVDFEERGRVSPLDVPKGSCPMERDEPLPPGVMASGCFYRCRAFNPKKGDPPLTKELALALYDAKMEKLK